MRRTVTMLLRALLVCLGTAAAGTLMLVPLLLPIGVAMGAGLGEALSLLIMWLPGVLVFVALATCVGLLFVGLPAMLLLRAAANEGGASYSWSGAAGGFLLVAVANLGGDPLIPTGVALLLGVIYGAVAGFLFWILLRKRTVAGTAR